MVVPACLVYSSTWLGDFLSWFTNTTCCNESLSGRGASIHDMVAGQTSSCWTVVVWENHEVMLPATEVGQITTRTERWNRSSHVWYSLYVINLCWGRLIMGFTYHYKRKGKNMSTAQSSQVGFKLSCSVVQQQSVFSTTAAAGVIDLRSANQ